MGRGDYIGYIYAINDEQTPGRFKAGTLAKIDASLKDGEKRSDFIREAVERELKRRLGR